ncbi:hypothetical protein SAMN05421742_103138 [Roseospirillum parvum]|uniref:Uncharacterized protein n=1 Tax=Roseospirillum parvum TaxID=83401 RepID=A0A1G7XYQ0_9PROT|nr:hypothetical protein SAMN05421742_103138 [Roseospirillum parvum]
MGRERTLVERNGNIERGDMNQTVRKIRPTPVCGVIHPHTRSVGEA